jgi:hypothetical protein
MALIKKKKTDILIQDKMEEARMEREERVITNAIVNYFAPLSFLSFLVNFIPTLMVIIPVEEENMCWFYFMTKSPFVLDFVPNPLFHASKVIRLVTIIAEVIGMLYFTKKLSGKEINLR